MFDHIFLQTATGVDRNLVLLDVLELTVATSKLGAVLRLVKRHSNSVSDPYNGISIRIYIYFLSNHFFNKHLNKNRLRL